MNFAGEDSQSDAPWGIVSIKAQDTGMYTYASKVNRSI